MYKLTKFQNKIGFQFKDPKLLKRALTHRSYLNEAPDSESLLHNERLEFLGDAIMDFLVGEYLFHHLPEMQEGNLTFMRAALVRSEGLARFANQIHLGSYVVMGRGEEQTGGRRRESLLADAFEALVAAMYLDQGLDATRAWVEQLIAPAAQALLKTGSTTKDAKSNFQELAQAKYSITPRYKVLSRKGPDHERTYTIQVLVGDDVYGEGRGRSKQIAAQAAARKALARLQAEA